MARNAELNALGGVFVSGKIFPDLKQRQIAFDFYSGRSKHRVAAKNFCSVHAVSNAIDRFETSGNFEQRGRGKPLAKCTDDLIVMLLVLVEHYPRAMLHEYRRLLELSLGLQPHEVPSETAIWRIFRKYKITRKKLKKFYQRRFSPMNSFNRQVFIAWRDSIPPALIYSLDETGIEEGSTYREFGWSPANCPINDPRENARERCRWNVIACVGYRDGVVAAYPVDCTVNRTVFNAILRNIVLPNIERNSFLIMDNCSIHNLQHIQLLCLPFQITPVLLPAYSPDLQPIEKIFGLTKSILKRDVGRNLTNPRWQIMQAFMSVPDTAVRGFYHKCWEERR